MKIILIAYLHGFGGAEKAIIDLANELAMRKHDITLISLAKYNSCYKINHEISVIPIVDQYENRLFNIFSRYINLKAVLKKIEPQLIINFWFQSAYLCKLLKTSAKIIYSERGNPADNEYSGVLYFIRNHFIYKLDGLVFQSNKSANYFNLNKFKSYKVIQNPVNIPEGKYPYKQNNSNIILTMGRLHEQKNHKCLLDAFKIIKNKYPNYKLYLYGTGELKEYLIKYCVKNNILDVFFKGNTEYPLEAIYNSEIFVLSSDYEGMPNVLLEAMALGKPCVSTNYDPKSVDEIIKDGVNGIIADKNNPKNLADKIELLILDKNLRSMISKNALKIRTSNAKLNIYNDWEDYLFNVYRRDK